MKDMKSLSFQKNLPPNSQQESQYFFTTAATMKLYRLTTLHFMLRLSLKQL